MYVGIAVTVFLSKGVIVKLCHSNIVCTFQHLIVYCDLGEYFKIKLFIPGASRSSEDVGNSLDNYKMYLLIIVYTHSAFVYLQDIFLHANALSDVVYIS